MIILDFAELANQNREAAGRVPMSTDSGKSSIINYVYSVILQDADQTSKDIESLELHEVGDVILDLSTGHKAKITRVSRKTVRIQ